MNELNELLVDYQQYLKKIAPGAIYISDKLKEEDLPAALAAISDFSEGMTWLTDATAHLKENGFEISLDTSHIKGFLIEINNGLEKSDFLLVSDIFEYEIAEYFERLVGMQ